ncbi:hypothetical protein SAMN05444161_6226 [Rhizobiales bacterium GAS191]|nr:hypothetical protein SAMN05444161_6226 [Rhizobiales bacterium GAS191]
MKIAKRSKKASGPNFEDDGHPPSFTVKHAIDRYLSDVNALELVYPLVIGALDASFKLYGEGFAKSMAANADPVQLKKFVRGLSRMIADVEDAPDSDKAVKKRAGPKSITIPIRGEAYRVHESLLSLSKVGAAKELICEVSL